MIKVFSFKYFDFVLHGLVWSVVLFFPFFVTGASDHYKIGPIPGLYFTYSGIIHIIIFYLNALVLYPKFLNRVYWLVYVISVLLLIFFSYWVKFYILTTYFPYASIEARSHVLFPSAIVFIASVFYSVTIEKIRTEKLQKKNEAMQLGIELKFLRSQISPHFLFNVLTNLVYLARKKSDNLETSLLMLSGLMRYMLYGNEKKISMQQEIEYLESYVALQKLRFGRDVEIVFNIEVSPDETNHIIEPMILIPFIENAFKHGTGYVDKPAIDINLTFHNGLLVFDVKNKFDKEKDTSKDESSGIGVSNVRSRLTLLYPGRHDLVIHTDDSLFLIALTLKLS